MDEAQAADVERARQALRLAAEMSPAVRRWLLDQLVTACALDQDGIEWEIGTPRPVEVRGRRG